MIVKATAYVTIDKSTCDELDEAVNEFLAAGWVLYGEPRHCRDTKHNIGGFFQTLVRLADDDRRAD